MNHQEALTSYIGAFVAELVHTGIKDVVISPGSRSTPIAMVMAEHPELRLHIHVDERSAAFFALGIAKASGNAVAILCTSGTAAANYYPAIAEANISRVPLLVITADRPHELRDVGAPQAIDQIHLYGKHVKWFMEMAIPEGTDQLISYARTVCARAASTALAAPAGPVHLNFPFREPLIPNLQDAANLFQSERDADSYVTVTEGNRQLHPDQIEKLSMELNKYKNGIIVCGTIEQQGFSEAVTKLAEKLQFPILADPLSQLRSGQHDGVNIIDAYDTFLRNDDAKKLLKPDIIIRFGAMPISKALLIFIKENSSATQWVVDGGSGWREPTMLASSMLHCHETSFCEALAGAVAERSTSSYTQEWQSLNAFTKNKLTVLSEVTHMSEAKLFYEIAELLPEGATLFVGNSMPIRDIDSFFHFNQKGIRLMANRGANGIDGTVSTALGAAVALDKPIYLVVGDLTFFHDLNGLIMAKLYNLNIKIIVINNNGGGIFSFLPQYNHPNNFELLFGTPLDLNFEYAIRMYEGDYELVSDWAHLTSSFLRKLPDDGLSVFEVTTNRDTNLAEHRNLWEIVSQEISQNFYQEKA